jgi:hypothetical protein
MDETMRDRSHVNKRICSPFTRTLLGNEDALLQFLVRTPAADHAALRCVCKNLRRILDSHIFRRERMLSEWAQVQLTLKHSKQPQDQKEGEDEVSVDSACTPFGNRFGKGLILNEFQVLVDGKEAGSGKFTLIQRRRVSDFHYMCDGVSDDLEYIGCLFFDNHGRPILDSLKQALAPDKEKKWLFYMNKFQLNQEHREHTWVGACVLRSLLMDGILKDQWSIAAYVADERDQRIPDRDNAKYKRQHELKHGGDNSDAADKEVKELDTYFNNLGKLDIRQFLRAGFQQCPEASIKSTCYHVFAVPSFLQSAPTPMISHQETMTLPIISKSPALEPPSGQDARLLSVVTGALCKLKSLRKELKDLPSFEKKVTRMLHQSLLQDAIQKYKDDAVEKIEEQHQSQLAELTRSFEGQLDQESRREEFERSKREMECSMATAQNGARRRGDPAMEEWQQNSIRHLLENVPGLGEKLEENMQSIVTATRSGLLEKLASLKPETKAEIALRLEQGASVKESNALHACAEDINLEYLELLVEFLPPQERRAALNKRNEKERTPLMVASGCYSPGSADERYRIMEVLMDLGADQNAADFSGKTALGIYRELKKFSSPELFGIDLPLVGTDGDLRFEAILRPCDGPSAADDAILKDEEVKDEDEYEYEDEVSVSS